MDRLEEILKELNTESVKACPAVPDIARYAREIRQLFEDVLESQSKISFKAGYNQCLKTEVFQRGRIQGIKEVVDWLKSLNPNYPEVHIGVAFSTWESKLKEWGIEDE